MKQIIIAGVAISLAAVASAPGQSGYTNFIRQIQTASGIEWDVQVASLGQDLSPLSVDPGGATFELWTVKASPLQDYLLDHKYVSTYIPQAQVRIYTEDPYTVIPRTRADRPFNVEIEVAGLVTTDPSAPAPAQSVNAMRYVQSYGADGDGSDIDRSLATLHAQASLTENQTFIFQFSLTQIPGADRAKVRGEERFVVMSLADYQAPASQLGTNFIQIWPVADGSIVGIEQDDYIRFSLPPVEIHLNDLYPDSETWAQVYPGAPQLGVEGTVVPGSGLVIEDSVPHSRVLRIKDWDSAFGADGRYTMEVLTKTPFGIERLDHVSFDINRTMKVNGNVTTIE
jgi:hypothetical protein